MFADLDHTYVIAEAGSNHAGSLDAALVLIDAAAMAGADACKFQAGHADHVYDPTQYPEEHASFKKYVEPVLDWLPQLAKRCEERGIDFGCSAFCFDALDVVDPYVKWHKVAGIEAHHLPFVRAIAAKGKPILMSISLGGPMPDSYWGADVHWPMLVPLHCVTAYPAPLEDVNLRSAGGGRGDGWGLSDHTTHPTIAPCAAATLGAKVIEKHIKLGADADWSLIDPKAPDMGHSLFPSQFREMVVAIRLTEKVLGSREKRIRESEMPYLKYRRGPKGLRGA